MPKWALGIGGALILGLFTLTAGLLVHVFNGLSNKVDKMSDAFNEMRTQVVLLQAQVETQSKFCRFPKTN